PPGARQPAALAQGAAVHGSGLAVIRCAQLCRWTQAPLSPRAGSQASSRVTEPCARGRRGNSHDAGRAGARTTGRIPGSSSGRAAAAGSHQLQTTRGAARLSVLYRAFLAGAPGRPHLAGLRLGITFLASLSPIGAAEQALILGQSGPAPEAGFPER